MGSFVVTHRFSSHGSQAQSSQLRLSCSTCGILVPQPGVESTCCIARWIPNHCTVREAPVLCFEYVWVHGPGEGNGNPLQQWCLGNPMDRGAWQAIVHGVAKSWT